MSPVAAHINALDEDSARSALHRCCGCNDWVSAMLEQRPFASDDTLFSAAVRIWCDLRADAWHEAFRAHPRIGQTKRAGNSTTQWERAEQAGASGASTKIADALQNANTVYEQTFGHVFLICATGKTADEMLVSLQTRLHNDPETELQIAAEQQAKITRLRLEKLVSE